MKPHARIRKTIKWGGAVVTVLLVVAWVGSGWFAFGYVNAKEQVIGMTSGVIVWRVFGPAGYGPVAGQSGWIVEGQPVSFAWGFLYQPGRTAGAVNIPIWCVVLPVCVTTVIAWRLDMIARGRARACLCPKCDYDRTGLSSEGAKCPECGSAPA